MILAITIIISVVLVLAVCFALVVLNDDSDKWPKYCLYCKNYSPGRHDCDEESNREYIPNPVRPNWKPKKMVEELNRDNKCPNFRKIHYPGFVD